MKRSFYIFLLVFYCACSKSESPTVAPPGQVEGVSISPGKERARLTFAFSDPDIAYFEVYWKGKTLSKRIEKSEAVDRVVTTHIENLEEGNHAFDVVAYNTAGTASAPVRVQSRIYGSVYQSGLANRQVEELVFIQGNTPYIEWKAPQEDEVAVDIGYTTAAGSVRRVRLANGASRVLLPDYKQQTEISYQTLFLPEQNCIDTFATVKERIPFLTFYVSQTVKNIVERSGLVGKLTAQSVLNIHTDAEYTTLQFENGSGVPFSLFVVKADLGKGNLSLTTLMPDNATAFGLQTVKDMATHRDAAGGKIVAAVNADFFDWSPVAGRPWGPVVVEETVVKSFVKEGVSGTSYFGVKKDGAPDINLVSGLSAADYNTFSNLTGAGANLLFLNGSPRVYNDAVREPRTMIGYTTDKIVYLVVVDGRRSGYSVGMTIDELVATMRGLGVYSATNLDGGGSSTMVLKKEDGGFEVVNRYSDAAPRAVANAIAVRLKE